MIPARKFTPGEQLVWLLIRTSLRGHFDRIFFRMQEPLTEEQRRLPIIICANHSSWWDGYVAALVERHLKLDGYLMMEEAQLKRYFFFRWVGCFSVDRHNARSAMQSVNYAGKLLKQRRGRMVWLFPQGEISPNDYRPLTFFSGAAHIARLAAPALVYPAAIRIEYLAEQRPDLYISLGEPLKIGEAELQTRGFLKHYTACLQEKVAAELDQLRDDVIHSNYSGFTQIMHGRASTNRLFDAALLRKQIQHQ
ncbi:lysophospholipid acyltransferase family protein [Dictyobacter aurantiacus]|uniref:Glycerol acyltransferase n=1 Tax=Dictyobacter aurantiacus TaxID=1936993 RepID=A0A401ZF50_9CHLR|nr:lysophospholipid acyltransferase family protein [Dictyobacter aurantiacus]GCE05521.1 glycerol acyltransferase [Dictyobacter aurantiacus]